MAFIDRLKKNALRVVTPLLPAPVREVSRGIQQQKRIRDNIAQIQSGVSQNINRPNPLEGLGPVIGKNVRARVGPVVSDVVAPAASGTLQQIFPKKAPGIEKLIPTNKPSTDLGVLTAQGFYRAGAGLGLEALRTNKRAPSIPDTPFSRAAFGESFLGGEQGGSVDPLSKQLENISKGQGLGGQAASFIKSKTGISPALSAVPIGIAGLALDITPGGFDDAGKAGVKAVVRQTDEAFDVAKYVGEQVGKQKAARSLGKPGIGGRVVGAYRDLKNKFVDFTAPIEDKLAAYEKTQRATVLPSRNIRYQIDRTLRADALAGQFIKDSGFENVISKVDNLDEFEQYLIARQGADVAAQGIKTGRDLTKDTKLVEALGPKYEPFAQQVTQYSHKLLDYVTDSGLISKELSDSLKVKYPNYVPLKRIFSEVEEAVGIPSNIKQGGPASLSKQTVVQKLEGSDREIQNPLESLYERTYEAFRQGERNKAANILADYVDLEGNPFALKKISKGADSSTGSYVTLLKNGKKQIWETTPEIAQAAKNLGTEQLNALMKIIAAPVRIFKVGTTGLNIPFTVFNVARDLVSSVIFSPAAESTVLNPAVFLKALGGVVKHGELYDDMVHSAAMITSFDIARDFAKRSVKQARAQKNLVSRIKYKVTTPKEWLRTVEDVIGRSEELSRAIQFEGMQRRLLAQGANPENAKLLAAEAARMTTANFARRGEWGRITGVMLPYLNAGTQGVRTMINSFAKRPARTITGVTSTLLFPMAAVSAWNLSDPTRKAAYDDIEEFEKEGNFIIIPPNPTKDERGRWNVIKIPLPPGVGSLALPVRKFVEQLHGIDQIAFSDLAEATLGAVSPVSFTLDEDQTAVENIGRNLSQLTPQALKPSLEGFTNKNFYTGQPQVPDNLKDLPADLQVYPWTSGTARKVGGALGVSPIKVEAFTKGTLGQVGSQVLNASDRALAAAGLIPKDQIGGESVGQNIVRRSSKATGGRVKDRVFADVAKYMEEEDANNARLRVQAQGIVSELEGQPVGAQKARVLQLRLENPQLADRVQSYLEDQQLGIEPIDRAVLSLGVKNGARARYIYEQMLKLPESERYNYLVDQRRKKIATDTVFKQVQRLQQGLSIEQ